MATAASQRQLTIAQQVKKEFDAYWEGAEKSRLSNPAAQRRVIAAAHKYAICFSYLTRALSVQPVPLEPHQRIFFQELTSDAVHLVHALTGGDARGARFYLRSVIENFWRHHYFRDHVIEYGWLHTRKKYYLEMKDLREHCSYLPCFQGALHSMLQGLPSQYADLSASVHSSSSQTLVLRQTLADIRLVDDQVPLLLRDVTNTLRMCLGLCMFSEKEVFLGLSLEVQQYLMGSLVASQQRKVQSALDNAEGG